MTKYLRFPGHTIFPVIALCILAIILSFAVSTLALAEQKATKRSSGMPRLPVIKTPADIEALSYLSKEEKALALGNMKKLPPSDPFLILQNDPELAAFISILEREAIALLDGDSQFVPFSPMNLITFEVGRRTHNDYLLSVFSGLTALQTMEYKKGMPYYMKLGILEDPDSKLWSEEERLAIKFTDAVLDNTMTDELFEQARKAWGEKKLLRHWFWLSYCDLICKMTSMLDLKYSTSQLNTEHGFPPEVVKLLLSENPKIRADVRKLWDTVPDMPARGPDSGGPEQGRLTGRSGAESSPPRP